MLEAAINLDIEPVISPLRTQLAHAKESIKELINEDITIQPGSPQEAQAHKSSEQNIELDFSSAYAQAMVECGGNLYIIGGYKAGSYLGDIWRFDIQSNEL